jgi:diaminohydroxyphosphoribosylaminopyrimidine deaminase / 5-amino-6-(5-phosphoribosylamino)uracil reductase
LISGGILRSMLIYQRGSRLPFMSAAHDPWMRRALELAERGRGAVEPNPLVGAVVVRDDRVAGDGWHQRFGAAHAEINALAAAGAQARDATLYVTLEPCCHHGKTPPCTDAIIRAGVRHVVAAMQDPYPPVGGRGIGLLREAGIEVEVGILEPEARRLNAPYLKLLASGRPYVHAKWAMTLDGRICTRSGDSKWISGTESRARVHTLRGRMDGIIVGIGTVLADDPLLTARPPGPRLPARIVLDSRGRLPAHSRLLQTAGEAPVIVATLPDAPLEAGPSIEIVRLPAAAGHPSIGALLDELGRRRMTNVLVEGGSGILGSFLDAAAIDEAHVFIAPLLVGGTEAKGPIGSQGVERLADAMRLADWTVERLGEDLYWHGWRQVASRGI